MFIVFEDIINDQKAVISEMKPESTIIIKLE